MTTMVNLVPIGTNGKAWKWSIGLGSRWKDTQLDLVQSQTDFRCRWNGLPMEPTHANINENHVLNQAQCQAYTKTEWMRHGDNQWRPTHVSLSHSHQNGLPVNSRLLQQYWVAVFGLNSPWNRFWGSQWRVKECYCVGVSVGTPMRAVPTLSLCHSVATEMSLDGGKGTKTHSFTSAQRHNDIFCHYKTPTQPIEHSWSKQGKNAKHCICLATFHPVKHWAFYSYSLVKIPNGEGFCFLTKCSFVSDKWCRCKLYLAEPCFKRKSQERHFMLCHKDVGWFGNVALFHGGRFMDPFQTKTSVK